MRTLIRNGLMGTIAATWRQTAQANQKTTKKMLAINLMLIADVVMIMRQINQHNNLCSCNIVGKPLC